MNGRESVTVASVCIFGSRRDTEVLAERFDVGVVDPFRFIWDSFEIEGVSRLERMCIPRITRVRRRYIVESDLARHGVLMEELKPLEEGD